MRATFGCGFLSEDVIDDSGGEGKGQNERWHNSQITCLLTNRTYRLCNMAGTGAVGWLEITVIY